MCKKLQEESDQELLAHLTKALASLANKKKGKVEIMENGAIKRIKQLLKHPDPSIKLNVIQLMANIAEHPKIKAELQDCLAELNVISTHEGSSELIKRFTKVAIDVITWLP